MYNYALETEQLIFESIQNDNCILTKKHKPLIYFNYSTKKLHRGLNQVKLAQLNFSQSTQSLANITKQTHTTCSNNIIICEKYNNRIVYQFHNEYKKINIQLDKQFQKPYYDFYNINELIEYYFVSAINNDFFLPHLNSEQLENLKNFIKEKPLELSRIINTTFNSLTNINKIWSDYEII